MTIVVGGGDDDGSGVGDDGSGVGGGDDDDAGVGDGSGFVGGDDGGVHIGTFNPSPRFDVRSLGCSR